MKYTFSISCSEFSAAKILEQMILNGPSGDVAAAQEGCQGEVVGYIKESVAKKDEPHRDVVKHFGSSCRKFFIIVHISNATGDISIPYKKLTQMWNKKTKPLELEPGSISDLQTRTKR